MGPAEQLIKSGKETVIGSLSLVHSPYPSHITLQVGMHHTAHVMVEGQATTDPSK